MKRIAALISRVLVKLLQTIVIAVVLILAVVILLPFAPLIALGYWARGRWLRWRFLKAWAPRGKFMIFVYSESPNWREYIEANLLPVVNSHAVVLNWSKRSEWKGKEPIEVHTFRWFAGPREFNPIAIFIPHRGKVQVVRFFQAFRDYKHGKTDTLRAAESSLLTHLKGFTQAA